MFTAPDEHMPYIIRLHIMSIQPANEAADWLVETSNEKVQKNGSSKTRRSCRRNHVSRPGLTNTSHFNPAPVRTAFFLHYFLVVVIFPLFLSASVSSPLSFPLHLSVCLSICLSVCLCLSLCVSLSLSLPPPLSPPPPSLLYTFVPVSVFVSLRFCLSLSLALSVSLCLSLPPLPHLSLSLFSVSLSPPPLLPPPLHALCLPPPRPLPPSQIPTRSLRLITPTSSRDLDHGRLSPR